MIYVPNELSKEITRQKALNCYTASTTSGNLLNAYLNTVVLLRNENLSKVMNQVLDDLADDYFPEYFFEPSVVESLTLKEVSVIAKRIITTRYRLLFSRPFKRDFTVTVDEFWEIAKAWTQEQGIVIWSVNDRSLSIHEVTKHQAFFVGGIGPNIISKEEFSSSVKNFPYQYLQKVRFVRKLETVYG